MKKTFVVLVLVMALVLALIPTTVFAATTIDVPAGANTAQIQDAINSADDGDTIKLAANTVYNTTLALYVNTTNSITIDGNGATIHYDRATSTGTYTPDWCGITVNGGKVTIKNITIENATRHGLNLCPVAGTTVDVTLENVTIKDSGAASIVNNSSSLTATGLTTSGAAWGHSINLGDQYGPLTVDVDNTSDLGEGTAVVLDDSSKMGEGYTSTGNTITVTVPVGSEIAIVNPYEAGDYLVTPTGIVYYDQQAVEDVKEENPTVAAQLVPVVPTASVLTTTEGAPTLTSLPNQPAYTDVIAQIEIAYVVIIPEVVDFGSLKKTDSVQNKQFDIQILDAMIEENATVSVTLMPNGTDPVHEGRNLNDFTMYNNNGEGTKTLPYKLTGGHTGLTDANFADAAKYGAGETVCTFGYADNNIAPTHAISDDTMSSTAEYSVSTDPGLATRAGFYLDTMYFTVNYNAPVIGG